MDIIVISAIIFSLCNIGIAFCSRSKDTDCRIASNILLTTMAVNICMMYIEMGFAAVCIFGPMWINALRIKNKTHSNDNEEMPTSTKVIVKKKK